MNRSIEYGLISTATDEKALTAKMKSFFEPLNRVMVKTKSKGLLEAGGFPYITLREYADDEERL